VWPRLLLFVPCDRVIIDQESQGFSLISVFQNIRMLPPPENAPDTYAVPLQWHVVTMLYQESDDDTDMQFEMFCDLVGPDDKVQIAMVTRVEFTRQKRTFRNIARVGGFPVSRGGGRYWLNLSIQRPGSNEERYAVARYPITITFGHIPDQVSQ
jgi:hypothetical protein